MPLRRTFVVAISLALLAPAAARADITVSNVKAKPADTKAGANSDFTLSFDLAGSETIRDVDVNLPPGLLGNPTGAAKCTQAQFSSDSCPAQSKVGTQTVTIRLFGVIPGSFSGDVYNLVPDKPEPAQLGIKLTTPAGTQHLKSDVAVRPDGGLTSSIRGIPDNVSGAPINTDRISLTLQAKSGANKPFMTNPTSCDPHTTVLHVTGNGNGTADGQDSFTPTACDALPYAPQLSATVGAAGQTAKGSNPPLTTTITQGPGESASKSTKVTLPPVLSPNPAVLGNVCSQAAYASDSCPPQSQVGTATAVTPLLVDPLTGPVRLVESPGGLPKVVVYLNGVFSTRLVGDVTLAAAGTSTTFSNLPDSPISSLQLAFSGGSGGQFTAGEDLCSTPVDISGEFLSQSGKTATPSTRATVVGCSGGGGNGGGGTARGRWPTGTVALSKLGSSTPALRFSAQRGAGSKKLRSVALTLPGPLSFDKGYLSPGVKASKPVSVALEGKHTIRLTAKAAAGFTGISAVVRARALRVSSALRKRVPKHPKVSISMQFSELGGRVLTRHKRVTVR
jgi:hypothetical protein